jgi:hypothetical protein
MSYAKYIIRTREISEEEARQSLNFQIDCIDAEISELQARRANLTYAGPVTTCQFQEEVMPGHPDYEKASFVFSHKYYMGDWKFVNNPAAEL